MQYLFSMQVVRNYTNKIRVHNSIYQTFFSVPLYLYCKFSLFIGILLLSTNVLVAQEAEPQELEWLLIIDFATESGIKKQDKEKAMEIIRTEIEKLKVFKVREKDTANQIIDEKVEELRGCVEIKCSALIGKFADVPKVLDGTISKQGKGFTVTWNLLNVQTEQIEFTNSFIIDNPDLPEPEMKTPGERLKAFVLKIPFKEQKPRLPFMWRSALLPGWGQIYDGRTTQGYLFTGFFLVGAAYYYTTLVEFQKKEQAYKSTPFLPASDAQDTYLLNSILLSQTRADYKDSEKTTNNALYFLAGVYVWNLVDAFVYSGRQEEKKENLSFGVFPRITFSSEKESVKLETYYQINYNFKF